MKRVRPLIVPAEVGLSAILERDGQIYNAILPYQQPADGSLVAFCSASSPDAEGRFTIFRYDLDLLDKASSRQVTRVGNESKAVRLTIARAALFNREQDQREKTLI